MLQLTTTQALQSNSRISPILYAEIFSTDRVANSLIFSSDIIPTMPPSTLTITVSFNSPGILSVVLVKNGNTMIMPLNSGTPLIADSLYMFSHNVDSGDAINYMYSASCKVNIFKVHESLRDVLVLNQYGGTNIVQITDIVLSVMVFIMLSIVMTKLITSGR